MAPFRASTRGPDPLTDLGPAIRSVNVRAVGFGALPDGTPIAFALSNGSPAGLSVVALMSGKLLFSKELLGTTLGSWIVQAPNGDLFLSARHPTPAALYRFDIATMTLHHIADRVGGETALAAGLVDATGQIWLGSYPHAKVISYRPDLDEFHDHGSVVAGAAHVFALGLVDGVVWAGTGPIARLIAIDPATGTRTELHPPGHVMAGTDWFLGIAQRNQDVLVRLSPRGAYDTAIFHTRSNSWSPMIIHGTGGAMPTPVSANGTTYLLTDRDELLGYHTHSRKIANTPTARLRPPPQVSTTVNTYGLGMVRVPELGLPGQSVVGMTTGGDLWFVQIATGQTRVLPTDIVPTCAEINGIGTGPDGLVYLGARLSSGTISRIDPHTAEITMLRGPKQIDAIATHGDQLVMSSCAATAIHVGDPAQPWRWGTNPRPVLTFAKDPHHQERAVALASAGSLVAIGTLAPEGKLAGALIMLDPETGEFTVHRGIVPDQGVVSLLHHDGLLYGTTALHNGPTAPAAESEAQLFVWDMQRQTVVWAEAITPGAVHLGGLALAPDGMIIGTTARGEMFVFDPAARQVTDLIPMMPEPQHRADRWTYSATTVHDPGTDSYLATQSGHLVQVSRRTRSATILSRTMDQLTSAGDGTIVAIDETNAYVVTPTGPPTG